MFNCSDKGKDKKATKPLCKYKGYYKEASKMFLSKKITSWHKQEDIKVVLNELVELD